MIQRAAIYSPDAREDLGALYEQIRETASAAIAERYVDRVLTYIEGFDIASERGSRRRDVRSEVRIVGFERRLTIAFTVETDTVTILRIFRAGQDWASEL